MKKLLIIVIVVLFFIVAYFVFGNDSEIVNLNTENYTLDCHNSGEPWDIQNCEYIKKDLTRGISYVPDDFNGVLNEVKAPFTKERFEIELIDVDLWEPWDFEFLPDDSILFTQRGGGIVI